MMSSKVLKNIEPYNDLFFMNCFYNSLFSVVNYYNENILLFLVNSVHRYDYIKEKSFITANYISALEDEELMRNIGISVITKQNNKCVIQDIITAINNDRPVIINADYFYMPVRPEFYLKTHGGNVVLIYGYDEINKLVYVIAQKHVDSLTYYKTELKYEDLLKSFEGYLCLSNEHILENTYNEYSIQYYEKKNDNIKNLLEVYEQNFKRNIENFQNGLNALQEFISDFKLIFMKESVLKENIEGLLQGLNEIVNAKKAEKHKLQRLFGDDNTLTRLTEEIEDNWAFIRSKLAKYMFSCKYKQSDMIQIKIKLDAIYKAEQNYY